MPSTNWSNSLASRFKKYLCGWGMRTSLSTVGVVLICRIFWISRKIIPKPRLFCWRRITAQLKPFFKRPTRSLKTIKNRRPKNLWTQNADGEQIVYYRANDELDEAVFVARTIDELGRSQKLPSQGFCSSLSYKCAVSYY